MSGPTTAAQPSLTGLPVEVIEAFATLLDLPDLCILRLTSCELAAKASQGCYRTFFRKKEIDLADSEQLETFKRLTRRGGLGCLVENMTFLRYVALEDGGNHDVAASPDLHVLVDCLRNLKMYSASKSLHDLSLDVRTKDDSPGRVSPYRSMWNERTWDTPGTPLGLNVRGSTRSPHRRNWKATWTLGASLYRETMAMLHQSELSVKRLSVFGETENCSLGFDQLATYPEQALPSTSLATLDCLSLSLSHSVEVHRTNDEATEAAVPSHIHRIEAFLQLCLRLETLDLHFFKIWVGGEDERPDTFVQETRFFDRIAALVKFPHLTSCTFRGLSCKSISLQQFFEGAPQLQHVDIIHTNLTDGQWRPIFDTLCTQKLDSLHLDDLFEKGRIYFLGVPSKPKLVVEGQRQGTNELTRSGADTTLTIKYQVARGRLLGSPVKNRYMAIREWLYGPVSFGSGD
ncbi:hypothetical protein M409DRAFT_61135 [Zasmidium cellare ATCC 36951]|uniref:F-box domain-containing protein n=1 Tax=Zasmidium cellare ATCC 36951 TaxID=1080233 RepID=A0A6A6BZS2_ZASCE|nr:uncharacterized protein M409DRAFT_61135 [Zasmidium cellare ATCC 36951]KAF2159059.1 hypothetical protein M409DRAFT_61135 [Zasmidium cellare ATCC 36951]